MDNTNQPVQRRKKPCQVCGNARRWNWRGKCARCWKAAYDVAQAAVARLDPVRKKQQDEILLLKEKIREVQLHLLQHRDVGVCSCHLHPRIYAVVGKYNGA